MTFAATVAFTDVPLHPLKFSNMGNKMRGTERGLAEEYVRLKGRRKGGDISRWRPPQLIHRCLCSSNLGVEEVQWWLTNFDDDDDLRTFRWLRRAHRRPGDVRCVGNAVGAQRGAGAQ